MVPSIVTRPTSAKSESRVSHRRRAANPIPASARTPGSSTAKVTGLACVAATDCPVPFTVVITIALLIGAVVPGLISTFSGVNEHDDWSGKPEQDNVTNIDVLSALALIGVTVAVAAPDWPWVRLIEAGLTEMPKSGVVFA